MLNIPEYINNDFYIRAIDIGQESRLYVAKNTNAEEFNEYLKKLNNSGFTFYADNKIGNNLYATYFNDRIILNVMFIEAFAQTRVTVDYRDLFSLPGLENENMYDDKGNNALILLSDNKVHWPGRMGYAYKLADGSFFLIDGGYTEIGSHGNSSADCILATLKRFADDPNDIRIAAWLITHIHDDHFGGFLDLSLKEDVLRHVKLEKLIYNEPSDMEMLAQSGGRTHLLDWAKHFNGAVKRWNPKEQIKAHPGQTFYIKNLKMTVLSSQDLILGAKNTVSDTYFTSLPDHNETSVVTKIDFMGKTALYLGDSCVCAHRDVLEPVYNTELKADILQVAHHGYGNTGGNYIYKYVEPTMVFWPVCRNHFWGRDVGYKEKGLVYIGVKDVAFNKILFKEGMKHYIHEEDCIIIENFDTWEGVVWDSLAK